MNTCTSHFPVYVWDVAKVNIEIFVEVLGTQKTRLEENLWIGGGAADTAVNSVVNLITTAYGTSLSVMEVVHAGAQPSISTSSAL